MRSSLIVYFLHLHKHGGTSVCKIAKRQVYNANWKFNCNVPPSWTSGLPQTSPYFGATKKEGRVVHQKLVDAGREYAHSEGVLESWFPAKEWYTYVTMLRNPTAAMISGFGYSKRLHKHRCATFEDFVIRGIAGNRSKSDGCSGTQQKLWLNPMTQRLCGDGCRVPPDRRSLTAAKANLAQFTLVMFLDEFEVGIKRLGRIRTEWSNASTVHVNAMTATAAKKNNVQTLTPADLDGNMLNVVRKVSSLDQELYQWAEANCRLGQCNYM